MNITKEQALEDLYKAVRTINASAEAHEYLKMCIDVLSEEIKK